MSLFAWTLSPYNITTTAILHCSLQCRKIVSPMQQLGVTVAGGEVRPSTWHQHQPTGSSYCSAGLRQAGWSSLVSVNGSTMSDVTSCLHSLRQSSHDSGLYPSGVHKERFNIPDKENQSPCKTIGLSCRRQQQRKQRSQGGWELSVC